MAARLLCLDHRGLLRLGHDHGRGGQAGEAFGPLLPAGRDVGVLPVAGQVRADGTMRWTGVDMILVSTFTLRARTRCRRLLLDGTRVTRAELADVVSGEITLVRPRVTIVAADAIHTPQLLWASVIARARSAGT